VVIARVALVVPPEAVREGASGYMENVALPLH
jgi:hypothetical protein